jgi:hypothetical protein
VRWLAYLHPVAMLAVLALGLIVLLEGLAIRRARVLRKRFDSRRHRRLARWFVALVVVGFGSGLFSMAVLRGKPMFGSVHAGLTSAALVAFLAAATLGFQLERNPRSALRDPHVLLGSAGLLLAFAAAVAGFAILL